MRGRSPMPSKKATPAKEASCYLCGRSQSESRQLIQMEVSKISQSTEGYVGDLERKADDLEGQIRQLESFAKKIRKDISWETAIREPDAMMEFIPGLQEVWPALIATEPSPEKTHTLTVQTRTTVARLQTDLLKIQNALSKLKEAPKLETSVPFEEREVSLTVPSYELKESGDEVERVDHTLSLRVPLCPVCRSLLG